MKGPGPDAWAEGAAVRIAEALDEAMARGGRVSLVLAGGSTPEPVYGWLAVAGGIPWGRVEVYFSDERCVPPDHPDSNFRMARASLLDHLPRPPAAVHRIEAEREDRDGAAEAYGRVLPERPSILLLGIGEDGHTASLFPGDAAVDERERRVVVSRSPSPPERRITITPPVIEAAQRLFVLARGRDKARAVARALEGAEDARAVPARLARRGVWLLDADAAAGLDRAPE